MKKKALAIILVGFILTSCDILKQISIQDIEKVINTQPAALTNGEIVQGLKEALSVGTTNAVKILNKENGFFMDPLVKIAFPPEVKYVEDKLRQVGMGKVVDDFVLKMNRGAENAVTKASPIFGNAIKTMSITDAIGILKGTDNAATTYFKTNTSTQLAAAFKPEVQVVLDQMQVTKYWTDVTTAYNKIPLTKKVETDLAKYVTEKAMDGLFAKIAAEELKIRKDPVARVSEILRKVFGSLDK